MIQTVIPTEIEMSIPYLASSGPDRVLLASPVIAPSSIVPFRLLPLAPCGIGNHSSFEQSVERSLSQNPAGLTVLPENC